MLSDTRRQQGQWRGFPDALFCGRAAVLFAELKAPGKQPRGDQRSWHWWLSEAGARVEVWQPRHWLDGSIAAALPASTARTPRSWSAANPTRRRHSSAPSTQGLSRSESGPACAVTGAGLEREESMLGRPLAKP